jgi:parallel beta-helix repeat protein
MIDDFRFTRTVQFAGVALLLSFILHPASLHAQGTLTPPGAPAPTMKTLDQIEARTPVDAVHTPGNGTAEFIINQPGSYYLTTNIVSTNTYGIEISTNNTTLDLNGFSLTGIPGAEDGIFIDSGFRRIRVYNGIINNWLTYGISCAANDVVFEHLIISGNFDTGVNIQGGLGIILRDSTVNGNSSYGINCDSSTNVNLENLIVSNNHGTGISFSSAGSIISNCSISGNTTDGILLWGSGCLIVGNNCAGNHLIGINIPGSNNRIEGNHVTGGGKGFVLNTGGANNLVIKNTAEGTTSDYTLDPNQIIGPIITNTVSGIITNSNPWANFAF